MFHASELEILDIETTNTCNAKCPLCLRERGLTSKDILDWSVVEKNISKNIWQNLKSINFNGSTGDNLMHPDIEHILTWTAEQTDALIKVHTNGSLRSIEWWANLGNKLKSKNISFIFALDGLADTHAIYRINTNWQKIIDNATAFIENGGNALWQFILFDHNKHQIEECRALSEKLGFKEFFVIYQDRFDVSNEYKEIKKFNGDPVKTVPQEILRVSKQSQQMQKVFDKIIVKEQDQKTVKTKVNCRSKEVKWASIYADGTVWPCCWLMGWHKVKLTDTHNLVQQHFEKILKIDFDQISLYNNTLEEIIMSDLWQQRFDDSFIKKPNPVCYQQCRNFK